MPGSAISGCIEGDGVQDSISIEDHTQVLQDFHNMRWWGALYGRLRIVMAAFPTSFKPFGEAMAQIHPTGRKAVFICGADSLHACFARGIRVCCQWRHQWMEHIAQ